MPIYEFACPKCRKVFNFLSKTVSPDKTPECPKCGSKKMLKQVSRFAMIRAGSGSGGEEGGEEDPLAGVDEGKMMQAMAELERDMAHMDENNPKHMAHMMRKMKDVLPPDAMPRELDVAIRRLEAGEDPEKIEEDMGDVLGDFLGGDEEGGGGAGGYTHDSGLYDM